MTNAQVDIEGELYESAAIVRAARNALPDSVEDELVDAVSLLCAVEKKLGALAEAVQVQAATKGRGRP